MRFGACAAIGLLAATSALAQPAADDPLAKVGHIVVIFEENRSFDNFFGSFPGANGLAYAGDRSIQVDADGKPYRLLPEVMNRTSGRRMSTSDFRPNFRTGHSRSTAMSR